MYVLCTLYVLLKNGNGENRLPGIKFPFRTFQIKPVLVERTNVRRSCLLSAHKIEANLRAGSARNKRHSSANAVRSPVWLEDRPVVRVCTVLSDVVMHAVHCSCVRAHMPLPSQSSHILLLLEKPLEMRFCCKGFVFHYSPSWLSLSLTTKYERVRTLRLYKVLHSSAISGFIRPNAHFKWIYARIAL